METAPSTPAVPIFTAFLPKHSQICLVKFATDVLPFVPVTAIIVEGCTPKNLATVFDNIIRGSLLTIIGISIFVNIFFAKLKPSSSVKTAAALFSNAASINLIP